MRIARAVAFALAIAAPLAIFLWLQPKRGACDGARDSAQPAPADGTPAPPPAPSSGVTPSREPAAKEPTTSGSWRIELDLRGPRGTPLSKGRVRATLSTSTPREGEDAEFAWRRDAATIELEPSAWTLVAEAESDESGDAIPCGDLVSDPVVLDPAGPPAAAVVLGLHARPGIFGKVIPPAAGSEPTPSHPRYGVRWQRLDAGQSSSATWLALSGHDAKLLEVGGRVAYVVHDLESGRYAVAARGDPASPLESLVEVDVGDSMVRRDLSLATIDAATMLHAVVQGLAPKELGSVSFFWIGVERGFAGRGQQTIARSDAPGSFWIAPVERRARAQLQRVLDGTLAADEGAAVTLARDGLVVAAQPLTGGQHEVRFACDTPATLRVRFATKLADGMPRVDLGLAPAAATRLLDDPPATSFAMQGVGGPEDQDAGTAATAEPKSTARSEWTWKSLIPGDFVLVTWGQLHSELRHDEVWWPLARRDVVVKGGDQELAIDLPPLHPLEVRFDRERFGKDAHVQVVLRRFPEWPRFALADGQGIARFEQLPDGDYTVTVVGDMAGERDFTLPGTSELRVEPTRREEH